MKKKMIFFIFLISILFLNLAVVNAATCESCNTSNCEECGCVLSRNKDKCVYSNYDSKSVSCGDGLVTKIPSSIPKIVSLSYKIIQIAVPVVLIIMGMMDLFKGITAQKEDEIKKGQQILIKRLIAAGLVFFVFVIIKFFISIVADSTSSKIVECAECFINNKCDSWENIFDDPNTGFYDEFKSAVDSLIESIEKHPEEFSNNGTNTSDKDVNEILESLQEK